MSLKEQLSTDAQAMLNVDELAVNVVYHLQDQTEVGNYTFDDLASTFDSSVTEINLKCFLDSLLANNLMKGQKDTEDSLLAHVHINFTPKIYDKVTIEGITYTVKGFSRNDLFTSLQLVKNKRPTGKNYGFRS